VRLGVSVLLFLVAPGIFAQRQTQQPALPPVPASVELKADLIYATYGARHLHLDLYLPKSGAGPFPAVVYIHGGGWRIGNKLAFRRQAVHMATRGFVGACIEYRLLGEAKYPAAVYDAKAAVRWLRANAAQYRINPNKIGAAGGSSGGHLAAMLGTTHRVKELEGGGGNSGFSSRVQAVVAFNPALDLVELGKKGIRVGRQLNPVFQFLGVRYEAQPQLYAEASPITHVARDSAPFLLLHGTDDEAVPYEQSVEMLNRLKQARVRAELFTAQGAGHGFYQGILWYEETLKKMEEFFTSTLK
jgi:acetyl esterase/lipase